jgi:hypothetical protein
MDTNTPAPPVPDTEGNVETPESNEALEIQPVDKVPPAPRKEKVKYKLDGKEVEEEVQFDELVSHYRKGKAADQRFQEAAKTRKQAEDILQAFQSNPAQAMKLLGVDAREFAEDYLSKVLEEELLSPEQREAKTLKAELEKYRKQEALQKEAEEKKKFETQVEAEKQRYSSLIMDALKFEGIPPGAKSVARMATLLEKSEDQGYDLTPKEIASIVREEIQEEMMSVFGGLSEDQLLQVIPESVLGNLRKADLKKLSTKSIPKPQEVAKSSGRSKPETKAELMARLARIKRGEE